eukprot:1692850-Pleurochrysis_carterae.AAC.4
MEADAKLRTNTPLVYTTGIVLVQQGTLRCAQIKHTLMSTMPQQEHDCSADPAFSWLDFGHIRSAAMGYISPPIWF